MLLTFFLALAQELEATFSRRMLVRVKRLLVTGIVAARRHCITHWLEVAGRRRVSWSGDYRLFSERKWRSADLFKPVIRKLSAITAGPFFIALDDTGLKREGKKVKAARWMRDPQSPPFHTNLIKGVRFINFAFLLRSKDFPLCRALPIRFPMFETLKKLSKKAKPREILAHKKAEKKRTLTAAAVRHIRGVRSDLDAAGGASRKLVILADGGYCNRTVLGATYDRTTLLVRCRKNARLCYRATGGRAFYAKEKFTPDGVRTDEAIPWTPGTFWVSGASREWDYKELKGVLWQSGTKRMPLRLIVIRPVPYRGSPHGPTYYRQPAFLLTTDVEEATDVLIQAYIDRWEIEVSHREMKSTIGMGQSPVWSPKSVPRQPAFVAASYSFLLLAAHLAYGQERVDDYHRLPKWRIRPPKRASPLDMVLLLEHQLKEAPHVAHELGFLLPDPGEQAATAA